MTAALDAPPVCELDLVMQASKGDHCVTLTDLGRLLLPAITSVASMILQGLGLRYISASTSFVLSGSAILFTAALSVILLRSRLNALHCSGMTS